MKLILDDNGLHLRFAPLTLSRPVGDLRCGILTNTERWKCWFPEAEIFYATERYLEKKFPFCNEDQLLTINAAIIPNETLAATILHLGENEQLESEGTWLAKRGNGETKLLFKEEKPLELVHRWDIFQKNDEVLVADFFLLTAGRTSETLSSTNTVIGNSDLIFLEEGARVEASILNTENGPIYIGKNAEIMEGCMLRGPIALCEEAGLKMGAKIYGATTIGPFCKVGGEVSNCVFQAYSNKGHDGFLGNSLVGEWCNFGADSNTSNLKNNYSLIRSYSYETASEVETGLQFMGVCMGDHSKTGINTMLNTASVIGFSCNVFGSGFPSKFLPSFTWGGAETSEIFAKDKAVEVAKAMMQRRKVGFLEGDQEIFDFLFI